MIGAAFLAQIERVQKVFAVLDTVIAFGVMQRTAQRVVRPRSPFIFEAAGQLVEAQRRELRRVGQNQQIVADGGFQRAVFVAVGLVRFQPAECFRLIIGRRADGGALHTELEQDVLQHPAAHRLIAERIGAHNHFGDKLDGVGFGQYGLGSAGARRRRYVWTAGRRMRLVLIQIQNLLLKSRGKKVLP